jgi:hypothetical protein
MKGKDNYYEEGDNFELETSSISGIYFCPHILRESGALVVFVFNTLASLLKNRSFCFPDNFLLYC